MSTALDVARFFLASNPPSSITDLKLQKLCAYAQAISCAYLDKKLFPEDVEMWELEPVVREVYRAYKGYDSDPIPAPPLDLTPFSMEQRLILAGVNTHYAETNDAWELCKKSHDDFPGVRGTNHCLSFEELKQAAQKSPVLTQLLQADNPLPARSKKILSPEEVLHALAG